MRKSAEESLVRDRGHREKKDTNRGKIHIIKKDTETEVDTYSNRAKEETQQRMVKLMKE